jgi:hypothetical protein
MGWRTTPESAGLRPGITIKYSGQRKSPRRSFGFYLRQAHVKQGGVCG